MSVNVKIFLFLVLIPFFGCFNTKKITYFNDLSKANGIDSIDNFQPVKVQRGDILQVYISSIDKDVTLLFNPNTSVTNNNNNPIMQGYLVDNAGQIELPVIGKIYVKGNTTEEINELIRSELNKTLKNFNVSTRLINFRVSVLGDVAKPGTFNIQNERVSILEALSMAGDVNNSAIRDDIMLIREIEGKKKYISINLNDSKSLSSPYFYLISKDVIYVKPGPNVAVNTRFVQFTPIILSAISLIVIIVSTVAK